MSQKAVLERDPNQSDVPAGYTAYILRWPENVNTGVVTDVKLQDDMPLMHFESGDEAALTFFARPKYLGQTGRVLVKDGAFIDPRVLELKAADLPWDR